MNKTIHRDGETTSRIFDDRTLEKDYATLVPVLRRGLHVLDVGCGTGAISKDIARHVGRADAGMNNRIAEDLKGYFVAAGLHSIEVLNADEHYKKGQDDSVQRVGIWSAVAGLKQISAEGYIDDEIRTKALSEYRAWVAQDAKGMIMKLNDVRGKRR